MEIDWYAVWSHEIWFVLPLALWIGLIIGLDYLSQRSTRARDEQDVQNS